jgi:hypothetical protein
MGEIDHPSIGRVSLVWGCLNNPSRLVQLVLMGLMAPLANLRILKETNKREK